jgi:hypothetical protein
MAKVYLETTILSYLTARPSRDVVVAGHQQLTRDWWEQRRSLFDLYVSQLVLREAESGDPDAAERRLTAISGIPLLEISEEATELARGLVERGPIPKKAAADSLHIAIATVNGLEYLLTWNMAHIANAELRPRIERVCRASGYEPPVLCTPEQLMGGQSE